MICALILCCPDLGFVSSGFLYAFISCQILCDQYVSVCINIYLYIYLYIYKDIYCIIMLYVCALLHSLHMFAQPAHLEKLGTTLTTSGIIQPRQSGETHLEKAVVHPDDREHHPCPVQGHSRSLSSSNSTAEPSPNVSLATLIRYKSRCKRQRITGNDNDRAQTSNFSISKLARFLLDMRKRNESPKLQPQKECNTHST